MKRMLLLTDDELTLIVAWAEMCRDDRLHDFEKDDQAVLDKITKARLK